jgi:hypothetical protein
MLAGAITQASTPSYGDPLGPNRLPVVKAARNDRTTAPWLVRAPEEVLNGLAGAVHLRNVGTVTLFTPAEQREFIDAHIAHRLTALLSVIKREQHDPEFFSGKGDLYCGCIEGSYVMLRVFIEFLGVESSHAGGDLHLAQRTRARFNGEKSSGDTDIMLDCFGLPLVSPADFDPNQQLIARVHDGLSKSTAHFTYRTAHFIEAERDFLPAVGLVLRLLHDRFFLALNEVPKWHGDLPQ